MSDPTPSTSREIVRAAVRALDAFYTPDRQTAAALLDLWQRQDDLSEADRVAVLAHYRPADPGTPRAVRSVVDPQTGTGAAWMESQP